MQIKPFEFLSNAVRAKEIVTVLAKNGFADLLQKLDLPPRLLGAFGSAGPAKLSQWERIRIVMEKLGPTFIKIGQHLSMRPDVMPEALVFELRKLQEEVPPVSFDLIRPILAEELGQPVEDVFSSFDEIPIGGASMAQVHYAVLAECGTQVAVKVQRPGLEKIIDADFDILMWLAKQAHERLEEFRAYNFPAVIEALREGLERELDFRGEARSMAFFTLRNKYPEDVTAPVAYENYSSRRVLVMERIEGRSIGEIKPNSETAKTVARVGSRSLFHQIMILGYFHADPHAGNIRLLEDGRLCLLDWGLTGHMTQRMRFGLLDLFMAFVKADAEQVVRIAISLADNGEPVDRRTMEREVNVAIREHYNPDTGEGDIGRAILKLLYVFGHNGVDLARDYSLMAKSILCIEEAGTILDSEYNLRDEFEPVLKEVMKKRRSPKRMAKELQNSVLQGIEQFQAVPEEVLRILKKIEKDNLKLNLQHKGLEKMESTINDASNKVTLGIIIGSLLVGSSLIVTSNVPPIVFGYPILGWTGYVLSFLLGLYVAFDILRGGSK